MYEGSIIIGCGLFMLVCLGFDIFEKLLSGDRHTAFREGESTGIIWLRLLPGILLLVHGVTVTLVVWLTDGTGYGSGSLPYEFNLGVLLIFVSYVYRDTGVVPYEEDTESLKESYVTNVRRGESMYLLGMYVIRYAVIRLVLLVITQ